MNNMKTKSTLLFRNVLFLLMCSLFSLNMLAGGHLSWSLGGSSDIFMCQVNVPYTTNNTYYEVLGFGSNSADGSGYAGIQSTAKGTNFIYALWDTQNQQPIKSVYSYPNSTVENFGGEGTGMHILNFSIGWTANDWINIVSRNWNYLGHTYYGYWVFNVNRNTWYHLITFDYPTPNLTFGGYNTAFIEDWLGDLQYGRAMNLKEGWNRDATKKTWKAWTKGSFDHNNPDPYKKAYDWGIDGDHFFMNTGGSYKPSSTQTGFTLPSSSGSAPVLTVGQLKSTTIKYADATKQLNISWITDNTKSPQYSYTVEVFDNPNFIGTPVLTKKDITPHLRALTLSTAKLANGKYYARTSITDIFDQKSNEITDPFTVGPATGITTVWVQDMVTLYPNPFHYILNVLFKASNKDEITLSLYDVTGRTILYEDKVTADDHQLDLENIVNGVYFVEVWNKSKNTVQRIKVVKE
jgi:hypothetical protein